MAELLLDVVAAVSDRPDHRTRLEQACIYLGLIGIPFPFGAWIAVSSGPWPDSRSCSSAVIRGRTE